MLGNGVDDWYPLNNSLISIILDVFLLIYHVMAHLFYNVLYSPTQRKGNDENSPLWENIGN